MMGFTKTDILLGIDCQETSPGVWEPVGVAYVWGQDPDGHHSPPMTVAQWSSVKAAAKQSQAAYERDLPQAMRDWYDQQTASIQVGCWQAAAKWPAGM
jgi:hypothetical protein